MKCASFISSTPAAQQYGERLSSTVRGADQFNAQFTFLHLMQHQSVVTVQVNSICVVNFATGLTPELTRQRHRTPLERMHEELNYTNEGNCTSMALEPSNALVLTLSLK